MAVWRPLASRLRCFGGRRRAAAAVVAAASLAAALVLAFASSPGSGLLPCCLLDGWSREDLPPRVETGPELEVVISHYNAPLGWVAQLLDRLPANGTQLTIYSKGPHPPPGTLALPNVGREGHTYLHHLHARYDSLARVTLLLMDSTPLHPGHRVGELVRHWRRAQRGGFFCAGLDRHAPPPGFQIDRWQGTTDDGAALWLLPATPRPFGAWWAEHVAGPLPRAFCPNAVLAVHRDRVRLRPRSLYATLLQQTAAGPDLEAGHFVERAWAALFYAPEAYAGCRRA